MNIYLTFDYELFLGPKSGSVKRCLIEPTEQLISIASKHAVKMVFFVDVLYILKLKEYKDGREKLLQDYNEILEQLKRLVVLGHSVQLHLHPQWYFSTYDDINKEWLIDKDHYSLNDCTLQDCESMITQGVGFLDHLYNRPPRFYSYRAGGYSFPHDVRVVKCLADNRINIDSSVLTGESANTDFQKYDFSTVSSPVIYHFDEDICRPCSCGHFTEFPIYTMKLPNIICSLYERYVRYKYGSMLHIYGDGKGVGFFNKTKTTNRKVHLTKKIFTTRVIRASVDTLNAAFVDFCIYIANVRRLDDVVIIGHPKNQTDYSLMMIENIVKKYKNSIKTL